MKRKKKVDNAYILYYNMGITISKALMKRVGYARTPKRAGVGERSAEVDVAENPFGAARQNALVSKPRRSRTVTGGAYDGMFRVVAKQVFVPIRTEIFLFYTCGRNEYVS